MVEDLETVGAVNAAHEELRSRLSRVAPDFELRLKAQLVLCVRRDLDRGARVAALSHRESAPGAASKFFFQTVISSRSVDEVFGRDRVGQSV